MKSISTLLATFLICINLFAQTLETSPDTLKTIELSEIVISNDYLAKKTQPFSFQNVDINLIKSKNTGLEPSFLLSETPSMTVYSDAGSYQGYSYFRLRGIDQTRINMTLDGVPLNEPEDQGVYFSNYPDILNSISKIQIQRGVGLSKNGNASYAGSIQLFSPNLFDSTSTRFGVGYGSYNSYRLFGEHKQASNKKGFYLRASHLNSDGYKNRSANNSSSIFYSAGTIIGNHKLKLTGFAGTQKNEMAWLGISEEQIDQDPKFNANSQEDDQFSQSLTQLQHTGLLNEKWTINSSVYFNYLNGNYDFDFNNFLGLPSTQELYNYAFESYFLGLFSNINFETDNINWTTGIHINDYQRQHTGSERTFGQIYVNTGFRNELSGFSRIELSLGQLVLLGDLQLRNSRFEYEGNVEMEDLSWTFLNPKVGGTYNLNSKTSIYYSIGKTSREPTRNDIFGGSDNLLADEFENPLLFITEAESVLDHELGMRYSSSLFSANINGYLMDFENEIVLNGQFGPNGLVLNDNVEQSTRMGLELELVAKPTSNIKLINQASFNRSRIKEQNETFQPILTPSVIINQDIIYSIGKIEVGFTGRYQSSSFIDFSNDNEIEGYFLLNGRLTYSHSKWTFTGILNNITNIQYFNNGYVDFDGTNKYFVQAPINFYGMITFQL